MIAVYGLTIQYPRKLALSGSKVKSKVVTFAEPTKSEVFGRIGELEVRLASDSEDIKAALRLRQRVFAGNNNLEYDSDTFDSLCDHLLVVDQDEETVVATYRLLGQDRLCDGGFYSQSEFDVSALLRQNPSERFLEFGRSVVSPDYRRKRTIELLWHGSWAYVRSRGYTVMFGCASFSGTDVSEHASSLAFLEHYAPATGNWHVPTCGAGNIPIKDIKVGQMDERLALRKLPPLIKGYLRLGAMFSTSVFIDEYFGTTDVLVVLPLSRLNPRYVGHYGAEAERFAAP